MARGFFITGTDTDVGKTTIALGLMVALKNAGLTVAAMKPVSAGCVNTDHGLRNDDAVRLMHQASIDLPYALVNPYAFEPAIAPHIAAEDQQVEMDIDSLLRAYRQIAEQVEVVIVEGAGGWQVPLNRHQTMADLAQALQADVIQVVGLKLGCLNHALLTAQGIAAQGLRHTAWVANHGVADMPCGAENIQALQQRLPGRCLGIVPALTPADADPLRAEDIARYLDIGAIL
ncbi:MAG: dethiobiotin synthase [Gammaproteobacteria bacterium]|nr:dethiobiotin synthase [Gammaproteobacteria bacterium]